MSQFARRFALYFGRWAEGTANPRNRSPNEERRKIMRIKTRVKAGPTAVEYAVL
jgi:hypothetical protein